MEKNPNQPLYTGDIAGESIDPAFDYTSAAQEITFTAEEHAIWADLYAGIHQPHFLEHVCQEFINGLELLQLDSLHIPSIGYLNQRITPRTGWRIKRTAVRYTNADDWYNRFEKHIFLITDYLRSRDQMEFTPEPDMFHDIFGHLPYLTQNFYAQLEEKFAPAYLKATLEEKEVIKRLAWYTTEFGLVIQDGRFKVFGAGTISGRAELANTIMEFYRLERDKIINYRGDLFGQLQDQFSTHRGQIARIIEGINALHQRGQMSSPQQGWNVVRDLYLSLSFPSLGYLGGEVILAPFDIETIAQIPKTVYALNPMFFVCESFAQMDVLLDSYLKPIAMRDH